MLPGSLLNPGSVFTERQVQFLLREVPAHGIRTWQGLVHYVFIRLPAFYGAGNPDDYLPSNFLTSAATVAPL